VFGSEKAQGAGAPGQQEGNRDAAIAHDLEGAHFQRNARNFAREVAARASARHGFRWGVTKLKSANLDRGGSA
jgi:UDP-3-O-acyl-N-acetylglucosamine deacetylase